MAMYLGQFERAAAEIADDAVGTVKAADDAERGEFSLPLAGNDLDLAAADALGFGDEGFAVSGLATRSSRQHPEIADLNAVAQRAKPAQRRKRLRHGVAGEHAGGMDFTPQAGEHLLIEDWCGATAQTFVHNETDRVGSDIDDGDRGAEIQATLR